MIKCIKITVIKIIKKRTIHAPSEPERKRERIWRSKNIILLLYFEFQRNLLVNEPEIYCTSKQIFFWIIYFKWYRIAFVHISFHVSCVVFFYSAMIMNRRIAARSEEKQRTRASNINIINILFMRFFRICLLVAYVRLFFFRHRCRSRGCISHSCLAFRFHSQTLDSFFSFEF